MATPTSACARAGASLVPSPIIATMRPPPCSLRMSASLSSGLASARKSSTPASAAMAAAVSLLSPVIITVRMPILRSWAKRSLMPPLTMSLSWITPSTSRPSATTRGVPPERETLSTVSATALGNRPPSRSTKTRIASAAPLRMRRAGWPSIAAKSTPLMRVCAVKGTNCAYGWATSRPRRLNFSFASTAMLRPSGVSSASEASCAASARRSMATPGAGMNSVAWRLPSVMVPVLSSSNTSTSPEASTARPLMARTLCCNKRSMPAMPMALNNPPMVVGIKHTSRAINTGTENTVAE